MFIDVKLISGFSKPLTYTVPTDWPAVCPGTLVRVPLRSMRALAVITRVFSEPPTTPFALKEAYHIEPLPKDPHYLTFLQELGTYHQMESLHFMKRMQSFLKEKEARDLVLPEQEAEEPLSKQVTLTDEQTAVVRAVSPHITAPTYYPALLHGVTGSGKTEVYKALIQRAFREGKTTLFLLPEVSLAVQFERILQQQLPASIPLFSFHSATTPKQKQALWSHLLPAKPALIIGVHLPVLLPIPNLGLIIIDEEHEVGFQEKKHPKLNTKQAALFRARRYQIPIVMGSATPSVASLYNVQERGWNLFQLKNRFAGKFPSIQIVSLTDKKQRRSFWISDALLQALRNRLIKKEQSIVFLNRRGVCFFVQCKACSFIFSCNSCSVSLTLHADNTLRCHYCAYQRVHPEKCSECTSTEFLKKGIGTEHLVTILQKLLPTARIGRADLDATSNKKAWKETITAFEQRELDILVGTQTITKGYHFPHVTLVGVIWADINLNFPFYNAQETTLQQLIQVAGRAGRQHEESLVIIQTMTEHPIFKHMNEVDYLDFYKEEIKRRANIGYPPLIRLAEIELKHGKEDVVEAEATLAAAWLMKTGAVRVLGPAKPPVARIKKIFSRKIYLKAESFNGLQKAYEALMFKRFKSSVFFTPDPLN